MIKCSFPLVVFLLVLSSCSVRNDMSAKKAEDSSDNRVVIGFSIDTLAIERWQRDLDVFMASVRQMGADVIVQNAGNSIDEQKRQLMYLLDRNVDCMVVLPKEARAFSETVEKIRAKNIPVISYDRLMLDSDVDLYISIDSEKVGQIMAEGMMNLTGSRNWTCILGPEEDYNMILIRDSLRKTAGSKNISLSGIFHTKGWNYDLSRQYMIDLVTGGKIPSAVVCGNDAIADSVISVLKVYYPDIHIPICGQDADIAACQNIVHGYQDFTVYKPIGLLAETGAACAVRLARGEKPQNIATSVSGSVSFTDNGRGKIPTVLLEPTYVDKNNIDDIVIRSGFHTEGEVYRNE